MYAAAITATQSFAASRGAATFARESALESCCDCAARYQYYYRCWQHVHHAVVQQEMTDKATKASVFTGPRRRGTDNIAPSGLAKHCSKIGVKPEKLLECGRAGIQRWRLLQRFKSCSLGGAENNLDRIVFFFLMLG
jgi:hypothetical protein